MLVNSGCSEKKSELIELLEHGVNPFEGGNDKPVGGKFTVSTTITKNQLPNLDFMTLMLASGITGIPIEFSKDIALKDIAFEHDKDFDEIHRKSRFSSLKIMPNIEQKEFNLSALFDFDINHSKRELTLKLLMDKVGKLDHYPYEFNICSEGKKDITFNFNCNMSGRISEIVKFNALMKNWEDEGFRRLIIYSGLDGEEPIKIVPPNIKRESGTFISKFTKIITRLKMDTDDCPYLIRSDIVDRIENIEEKELTDDICIELIDDIKKAIPKQVTKFYLHIIDGQDRTLMTKCLGIMPYWFELKSLNIKPYNKSNKNDIKDIYERKHTLSLRKYCCGYSVKEFYDLIESTFSSARKYSFEKVLNYISKDRGDLAQFRIQIDFMAIKSTIWQEEQTVEIIIKKDEIEVNKVNILNQLLIEGNYVNAIPIMEELNRDEHLENLAFAYCLKEDYPKSIEVANAAIQRNYKSIAHFTKGLALVLSGKVDDGFVSYMHGTFLIDKKTWYPIALNNLISFLNEIGIDLNDGINKIIDRLKFYSKFSGKMLGKKCFCGSKKHYSSCCGQHFLK